MKSLRVLFVMPPALPTPPAGPGGIETVAAALLPRLRRLGVYVMLATPKGSSVPVDELYELTEPLYPVYAGPYTHTMPKMEAYTIKVMKLMRRRRPDLVHDFSGLFNILNTLTAALPDGNTPPVIHTMHGTVKPFRKLYEEFVTYSDLTFTAISQAQRREATRAVRQRTTVIYNGLESADYALGPGGDRYLVMGRLCDDKGQDRLIQYAASTSLPLDVAGAVAEITDRGQVEAEMRLGSQSAHFRNPDFQLAHSIWKLIDGQTIAYHGAVIGQRKHEMLGHARALVMPNRWAEPFGMVAIEAMASGTPVVGMATGALPELIVHGVTGYLAHTFDELCHYLRPELIAKLNRAACREHVQKHFEISGLAQKWLELYEKTALPAVSKPVLAPFPVFQNAFYEQIPRTRSRRNQ